MTFAYNPVRDNQYLTIAYNWKTYTIKPSEVAKNQLKYEFVLTPSHRFPAYT